MTDVYLKSTEADKYNSRGDFLHLDINYLTDSVVLDFDACTQMTTDKGSIIIGLNVTNVTGVSAGAKTLPLPMPLCFTIHATGDSYELFDMVEYKKSKDAKAAKKTIEPTPLEGLLLKAITAQGLDFSVNQAGTIKLMSTPTDEMFLSGEFPIEKFRFVMLTPSTSEALKGKVLGLGASGGAGGGKGYASAQTELAKMHDRRQAIKVIANAWLNDRDGTDYKLDDTVNTSAMMTKALSDPNLRDYLSLICGASLPVRDTLPQIGKTF
jgi:hypothetical protein